MIPRGIRACLAVFLVSSAFAACLARTAILPAAEPAILAQPIAAATVANAATPAPAGFAPRAAGNVTDDYAARIFRVLRLADYNTRVVLLGTVLLGAAAGAVGTFMLLRKRSLAGDVVGHASLPGVAIAFLIHEFLSPGSEKPLPWLLIGALATGLLGMLAATAIDRFTRIREEAALAIVLSLFFGFGITLFSVIQQITGARAAGLEGLIFGKASLLTAGDTVWIGSTAAVVLLVTALAAKELALVCFDPDYAAVEGWPVGLLDGLLMSLVAVVTVIGLQSVGLLLVTALMIIPPAAARFWTDRLDRLPLLSIFIGAAGAGLGTLVSAIVPKLAAGATIVVVTALFFVAGLLFGTQRGLLRRFRESRRTADALRRARLLPTLLELGGKDFVPAAVLAARLPWPRRDTERSLRLAVSAGEIERTPQGCRPTPLGLAAARRVERLERLWRLYLRLDPEGGPSRLHENLADSWELLEPDLRADLEARLGPDPQEAVA